MIEFHINGGNAPLQSIALQTRRGRRVSNRIGSPPDEHSLRRSELVVQKYGQNWEQRKSPCGVYNCAGHIWASRRTGIYEWEEIQKILEDDEYTRIENVEQCTIGDVVLYICKDNGDWIHIGRVFGVYDHPYQLKVLSKWGPTSGEFIHSEYDVHFSDKLDFYTVYYSDRIDL